LKTRRVLPNQIHQAFRNDIIAIVRQYGGQLSALEMLALSAHLVGQILAIQDQRIMNRDQAMEIVIRNIEQGNKEVIDNISSTVGSA
jgi:hypothetical protein